jgi:hypothetical protein
MQMSSLMKCRIKGHELYMCDYGFRRKLETVGKNTATVPTVVTQNNTGTALTITGSASNNSGDVSNPATGLDSSLWFCFLFILIFQAEIVNGSY